MSSQKKLNNAINHSIINPPSGTINGIVFQSNGVVRSSRLAKKKPRKKPHLK